jgi:leucyl-tRNA synthetase
VNGRHERCDTLVEQKTLKQWLLKITKYADRLIDGLQDVDYPSRIADQQINWIGRSKGAEVDFKTESGDTITVFTTRPDTLFGATFLVLRQNTPW